MSTSNEEVNVKRYSEGSGLNCPTIGNVVPEGYVLVLNEQGKWVVQKSK